MRANAQWPSSAPLPAAEGSGAEPAPFTASRSEMPVVLETPVPRLPAHTPHGGEWLWKQQSEWLPRVRGWSHRALRNAPRTLVIAAPFIALFGIWLGHSLVSRHRHVAPVKVAAMSAEASQPVEPRGSALDAPKALPPSASPSAFAAVAAGAGKPVSAAPAAKLADSAELVHALTHGLPALESLAAEFPGDAQVAVALASEQARAQRFDAAVSTVEHALEVDPSSAQNGKVMSILWRAAQSSASEQAFLCLRKLGARGSDIAFDLATTPGVREPVRERAKAELRNFLAFDASADTRVAVALMLAPDCSTSNRLLDRAETEGGKRTLAVLERYSRGNGCGPGSGSGSDAACNSCMIGSSALAHALAKLSAGAKP